MKSAIGTRAGTCGVPSKPLKKSPMATISVKIDFNITKQDLEKGEVTESVVFACKGDKNDFVGLSAEIREALNQINADAVEDGVK